jgi:squalene cyclase
MEYAIEKDALGVVYGHGSYIQDWKIAWPPGLPSHIIRTEQRAVFKFVTYLPLEAVRALVAYAWAHERAESLANVPWSSSEDVHAPDWMRPNNKEFVIIRVDPNNASSENTTLKPGWTAYAIYNHDDVYRLVRAHVGEIQLYLKDTPTRERLNLALERLVYEYEGNIK